MMPHAKLTLTGDLPTHQCKTCGAFWRYYRKEDTGWSDDSWNLRSPTFGGVACCDGPEMAVHVKVVTWEDLAQAQLS